MCPRGQDRDEAAVSAAFSERLVPAWDFNETPQLAHSFNSGFGVATVDPIAMRAPRGRHWRLPQGPKCSPSARDFQCCAHAGSSPSGHKASPAAARCGAVARNRVTARATARLSRSPMSKRANRSKAASWRGSTSIGTHTRPCRRRSRYASLRWHARSRVPCIAVIASSHSLDSPVALRSRHQQLRARPAYRALCVVSPRGRCV